MWRLRVYGGLGHKGDIYIIAWDHHRRGAGWGPPEQEVTSGHAGMAELRDSKQLRLTAPDPCKIEPVNILPGVHFKVSGTLE